MEEAEEGGGDRGIAEERENGGEVGRAEGREIAGSEKSRRTAAKGLGSDEVAGKAETRWIAEESGTKERQG